MKSIQILLIISLFAFTSCNLQPETETQEYQSNSNKELYKVTKVIDGDTFWAESEDNKRFKVRIIGVDAPETRKSERKEIGYYGEEAKAYLRDLLQNKWVSLVSDVDSLDRFGRTLSYVYLEDETFVNAELIENGYASILTIPPNVKYADLFLKLQKQAREGNKGLWNKN